MAYSPPKGAGKGPGNGSPKAAPFTSETAKVAAEKAIGVREKMRKWREAHPEWQPKPEEITAAQLRKYARSKVPAYIDKVEEIALNDEHPKQVEALRIGIEQGIGRPPQGAEDEASSDDSVVKIVGGLPD
jgi:hypothetical protein